MDTDEWALDNGYISIVPTQYDLTDHNMIQTLKNGICKVNIFLGTICGINDGQVLVY